MSPAQKKRWRSTLRAALFGALAVLIGAEVLARVTLQATDTTILRWHDHTAQLKVAQMEGLADLGGVDVLIAGTSMAQQGLVPAVLSPLLDDQTIYNASLNGGSPVMMERWLLGEAVPRLHPDVVMWGLSSLDLTESFGDGAKTGYDAALATKTGALAESDRWFAQFSQLVAARRVLRDPDALFGQAAEQNDMVLADAAGNLGVDGERVNFTLALDEKERERIERRLQGFVLDREDLAAVVRTVLALRADGIDVIFVVLPVPERFTVLYPEGPERQQLTTSTITALGQELDVVVLSATELLGDDQFVDFTHLNEQGAANFSTQIGSTLHELGS